MQLHGQGGFASGRTDQLKRAQFAHIHNSFIIVQSSPASNLRHGLSGIARGLDGRPLQTRSNAPCPFFRRRQKTPPHHRPTPLIPCLCTGLQAASVENACASRSRPCRPCAQGRYAARYRNACLFVHNLGYNRDRPSSIRYSSRISGWIFFAGRSPARRKNP